MLVELRFKADAKVTAALRLRARIYELESKREVAEMNLTATINSFTSEQMLAYGERTSDKA